MVSMGIGENVSNSRPTRIFDSRNDAFNWVEKCFREQIEILHERAKDQYDNLHDGLSIGNSFALTRMEIEQRDV
jgi:hypothetical protein